MPLHDHDETGNEEWSRYPLEPADLAVRVSGEPDPGVTFVWKGRPNMQRLTALFETAAGQLAGYSRLCRGWAVTQDGPTEIPFSGLHPHLADFADATFVELECVQNSIIGGAAQQEPALVVFANLDPRGGTDLENMPESAGMYVRRPEALRGLATEIASAVSATTSPFFPDGRGYSERLVLEQVRTAVQNVGSPTLA